MNLDLNAASEENRFQQLIDAARAGDKGALGTLISEYRGYLLLIANAEIDSRVQSKLGASDIVQQSLMEAQHKLGQFRGSSEPEFRGWLRQILKNDLRDANRKYHGTQRRQVGREQNLESSQDRAYDPGDPANTPGTDALIREQAELLHETIQRLSPRYREIIDLRNWQELSFVEIGQRLDCSADAARKLWFRAVVKLEEIFLQQNPGYQSTMIAAMTARGEDNGES